LRKARIHFSPSHFIASPHSSTSTRLSLVASSYYREHRLSAEMASNYSTKAALPLALLFFFLFFTSSPLSIRLSPHSPLSLLSPTQLLHTEPLHNNDLLHHLPLEPPRYRHFPRRLGSTRYRQDNLDQVVDFHRRDIRATSCTSPAHLLNADCD